MSVSSASLPKLKQAKFKNLSFKSGATFEGGVADHKKSGQGIFSWPNGARYEGFYRNNQRHGKGMQLWQDGSKYEGEFDIDMRHGQGKLTWNNGESYEGTFFKDRRHGKGVYSWPDGSTYTGTFYMDRKEGYGCFKFANGNNFEGLYKEDERLGPGVMSYSDGSHDVGLWQRERLVKLCAETEGAFRMKDHKEFDYNPEEHIEYVDMDFCEKPSVDEVLQSPDIYDYLPETRLTEKVSDLYQEPLDPGSLAINREMFDSEFFKGINEEKNDQDEKIVAWNKTPAVIAMQRHVYKHRHRQSTVSFNVAKVLNGDRSEFKDKGPLEKSSETLIAAATNGDIKTVEDLLTGLRVSPDVADKNGHTALLGATVNWHMDVINCLLNQGADINKLNDEGCSPLSAAALYYYPVEGFRYNIAERYLEKPPPVDDQQEKKIQAKPKSILNKKPAIAKIKPSISGHSVVSNDSGLPQTESNQSVAKPQVRIVDPGEELDEVGEETGGEGDGAEDEGLCDDQLEFDSNATLRDYEIQVSEQMVERCATQLSHNERIVGGQRSHNSMHLGTVRHLAIMKNEKERMKATIDLLLRRGADPNSSGVPMPILFFAIKSADVDVVKTLLLKGASTASTLPKEKGGLAPLHIAVAIPGEEGVKITELLLNALADPDVRATEDDSFLNQNLEDEWSKDSISAESMARLGGRTPLHIACARDDNYKNACRVVRLLLEHKANTGLLCNGFSALALAIASGNDLAIDELLLFGADTSLPLTHGVGSALCVAASTEYEHRRPIAGRLQLIDKLIRARANILALVPIGPKRVLGTAVDYAYHLFNKDRRIGRTPYHALTHAERETFNDRQKLLAHVGSILRTKAVEREKRRLEDELSAGQRSRSPSPNFVYIGAGAHLPLDAKLPKSLKGEMGAESHVTFDAGVKETGKAQTGKDQGQALTSFDLFYQVQGSASYMHSPSYWNSMRPLFKYCYECGRSVGVRLAACTRCKEVYYCSKTCKLNAWNARHKEECIRIGVGAVSITPSVTSAKSRSPSPVRKQTESPTPASGPKPGKKAMVPELTREKQALRIQFQMQRCYTDTQLLDLKKIVNPEELWVPVTGKSKSAFGKRKMTEEERRRWAREHTGQPWTPPPGVVIHNYSHV